MRTGKYWMTWLECVAAVALLLILAAVLLPALSRAREGARRASCMNNLKQMALVLKMYAGEQPRGEYPPLSPVWENWQMDVARVYPEYLTDLHVFVCPQSPFASNKTFWLRDTAEHPGAALDSPHPDCVSSLFYIYTGYALLNDAQAVALFRAYCEMPSEVLRGADLTLDVPVLTERQLSDAPVAQAEIPLVWDRVFLEEADFAHRPLGGNVLYLDGHVAFVPYSYYNESAEFPITRLCAETFGAVLPRLSADCY